MLSSADAQPLASTTSNLSGPPEERHPHNTMLPPPCVKIGDNVLRATCSLNFFRHMQGTFCIGYLLITDLIKTVQAHIGQQS